ncbi:hypothetical protein F4703DRAFT_1792308 [Phycomyces blakesleeanus]|uniref:SERTA domain-containing protein n=1 Tax=Phycomyces blakesleeanus (strain ATCC 8743b / DSM 1359 / FGSC 10004 / NBRC 33097 / NRRL 1555) TaxID=763407 RepID=A0A162V6W6_PHYB8|nr:hypothetical protein PHYBLDRAFT_161099 [Phycomyces blakesleeanus NRRL 1555(-)]OAD80453.1 hypothetical protein PHYBLDRAFT_161099 [Phycomyces blakesleeanus NRRL 1555(-)]|eukprot:XP_018298493.1 hypothetical protein PHYBLDRAFT_161099 [Phycomyces blakesleeanus NRRL 1555(-)]
MASYQDIAYLSLSKLNSSQHSRTEPKLRRQVLVRNILLTSLYLTQPEPQHSYPQQYQANETRSQEEIWLDACFEACFDQLDYDDDMIMDDETDNQDPCSKGNNRLVLAVPFDYVSPVGSTSLPPDHQSFEKDERRIEQRPIALIEWSW